MMSVDDDAERIVGKENRSRVRLLVCIRDDDGMKLIVSCGSYCGRLPQAPYLFYLL